MSDKTCEIQTIGEGVESFFNRLFHGDITFVSQTSQALCQTAETNILLAMLLAFVLPFIEAFVPALPYTAFVIFNVNLLGGLLGFTMSLLGTVVGSYLLFLIVRFFFQNRMLRFLEKHNQLSFYNKIVAGIEKHGVLYVFVIYGVLGLILPSSICTISIGLTSFSKRKYLIGLLVGKATITAVLVFFGKSITNIFSNPLLLAVVIVSGIVIYYGTRKLGKHLDLH